MERINLQQLLRDFDVSSEEELLQTLYEDSQTLKCIVCKRVFPIEYFDFPEGDPVCGRCK